MPKLFGKNVQLSATAQLIMDQNLDELELAYSQGFNINAAFPITMHTLELPVTLAACENKTLVLQWLINKKVDLSSKQNPIMVAAAAHSSIKTLELLIHNGANINARDRVGKTALHSALYHKRYDIMRWLITNGYLLEQDGVILRQAVSSRNYQSINLLLEFGINVNFHLPNMVFPYNTTAVAEAARNNDLCCVKLLVEHGADVTLKDKYGERPYNLAIRNKNSEMIDFFKALEPPAWHDEVEKLADMINYKMPVGLIECVSSKHRTMQLTQHPDIEFITFHHLLNVIEVEWLGRKFIDLLSDVDGYSANGSLVWYPSRMCLATADYEHEEFTELCSWEDFIIDPSIQIGKIF